MQFYASILYYARDNNLFNYIIGIIEVKKKMMTVSGRGYATDLCGFTKSGILSLLNFKTIIYKHILKTTLLKVVLAILTVL